MSRAWRGCRAKRSRDRELTAFDSRLTCSALANHGVLPYDGRHLSPWQISAAICHAYNLSPTLAVQLVVPFNALWQGVSPPVPVLMSHPGATLRKTSRPLSPGSAARMARSRGSRRAKPDRTRRVDDARGHQLAFPAQGRRLDRDRTGEALAAPHRPLLVSSTSSQLHHFLSH